MRAKTKGRVAVGLILSLIAFGLGTGTAIISGHNQYPSNLTINTTPPSELPPIFTTTNPTNTSQNNQSNIQPNPTITKIDVENSYNQSNNVSNNNETNVNNTP